MYQSAVDTSFWDDDGMATSSLYRVGLSSGLPGSVDPRLAQERHQRRLLVAREVLLHAQLSIDEVKLSLSSRGNRDTGH